MREHFRGDLGTIDVSDMKAALTTFPRARSVELVDLERRFIDDSRVALVQWLQEGGRGRCPERIRVEHESPLAIIFVHRALQAGVLPSLKRVDARLDFETVRYSLTGGFLRAVRELHLDLDWHRNAEVGPQLAALGVVRQLPALARLEVALCGDLDHPVLYWPPFIPASLKALRIEISGGPLSWELLIALPGMLEASGARLDRLEVLIPSNFKALGHGLAHVAKALHSCSTTLKGFLLSTGYQGALSAILDNEKYDCDSGDSRITRSEGSDDIRAAKERLRVQWADVLLGVSACRQLHVLALPEITIEPLFPPLPPPADFSCLTHLEICDHEREHPPDDGQMGLWELMESGKLPALTKLSVRFEGRWGGTEKVGSRVAPAFEAVAGTLTHLHLKRLGNDTQWLSDEKDVWYQMGMAVGKLRRLTDLTLSLSHDGRVYDAFAQGLIVGGGGPPLPLLSRVMVQGETANADRVTSLLLPSVRVFSSYYFDARSAVLAACAVRDAGYENSWNMWCSLRGEPGDRSEIREFLRSLAPGNCRAVDPVVGTMSPSWTILPYGRLKSFSGDEE
jgi:hypothetical protein